MNYWNKTVFNFGFSSRMTAFVAVHAGAGYYVSDERKEILDLCKLACIKGRKELLSGNSAVDGCASSVVALEDSPLTNAGIGSNLTLSKQVECDAGLMDGKDLLFAGVGAVPLVKNPILLPYEMIKQRSSGKLSSKLIPPLTICGQGAFEFAKTSHITTVTNEDLLTAKTVKEYKRCLKVVRNCDNNDVDVTVNISFPETPQTAPISSKLDTVGSVAVDCNGFVAAGCSSGGILMKQPGRVGHSAIYGCGCWAQNTPTKSVAISVSGCGEYLMQTRFSQSCAEAIIENENEDISAAETIKNFFDRNYLNSKYLVYTDSRHKIAGAIILIVDRMNDGSNKFSTEFIFVHNSQTMCLAYTNSFLNAEEATSLISKSRNGQVVVFGRSVS